MLSQSQAATEAHAIPLVLAFGMHYDLIDLRLFLHVHEAGSITAGAARSHMTLASASARVRALEDTMGAPLLIRDRRGVRPTPAGQTLARQAQQVLAQLARLQDAMAEHAQGPRAHLRLLANTSAASVHLPPLLARFLAANPGYTLDLHEGASDHIVDALRHARAELAVVSDAADLSGLDTVQLCNDRLVLIVPRSHQLAGLRSTSLEAVMNDPFIGLQDSHALQALVAGTQTPGGLQATNSVTALGGQGAQRALGHRHVPHLGRLRWLDNDGPGD